MLRRYAMVVGIIFLVIGLLGFVPPLTPDGRLFGLFEVNAGHNWVHILSGLLGIWAGTTSNVRAPLGYAWFVLVAYGLITLLGFTLTPYEGMLLGFISNNMADNWLHLLLALSALAVILAEQRRPVFR